MKRFAIWLPIGLLAGLIVLFVFGLQNDPERIPSVLIGKEAPRFSLNTLNKDGTISKSKISIHLLTGKFGFKCFRFMVCYLSNRT